jgi:ferrous iron transport protein A
MRPEQPSSSLSPVLTPPLPIPVPVVGEGPTGRPPAGALTLDAARIGQPHVVVGVHAPAAAPEWAGWLEEIGFLPGERVMLMARAALGGDPLVVRVGQSTFALRAAEAACVELIAAS